MSNFIIEEFSFYKVSLFGKSAQGAHTDYGLQFNIPSGRVILRFSNDDEQDNLVIEKNDKKYFYIYLRRDQYPAFIDIFRNEKPLFFYYNFNNNQAYVTTSDEPVGEGPHDADFDD